MFGYDFSAGLFVNRVSEPQFIPPSDDRLEYISSFPSRLSTQTTLTFKPNAYSDGNSEMAVLFVNLVSAPQLKPPLVERL